MHRLLAAIVEDNRASVKEMLKRDGDLATGVITEARLYQSKIFHWIYVGDTSLHLAAAGYRVEIVRGLLAAGADPNAAGNHRRSTPLHYAADGFITGPVWYAKPVSPDVADVGGVRPSVADVGNAGFGETGLRQCGTLRCLLDAGADLHAQDKNGATALHRAVRTRCAAAVQFLLQAGADPTRKNKTGSTPFHLAVQDTGRGGSGADVARMAQRQIIETFVSLGISAKLKDGNGKTVLDCARSDWIRTLLSGAAEPTIASGGGAVTGSSIPCRTDRRRR
jgi:hypothetical protein